MRGGPRRQGFRRPAWRTGPDSCPEGQVPLTPAGGASKNTGRGRAASLAWMAPVSSLSLRERATLTSPRTAGERVGMDWLHVREPVSAWTHGAWGLFCLPATLLLQLRAGRDVLKLIGFTVFGLSLAVC